MVASFAVMVLFIPAVEGQASEAKQALESALVGEWKVPKNRYKEKITFAFTQTRTYECTHAVPNQEAVT